MEKQLSKQQLIAIEKIKRNQASKLKTKAAIRKSQPSTKRKQYKSKRNENNNQFFPVTKSDFYGTFKPAEAQPKGELIIKALHQLKESAISIKRKKVETIDPPFSFSFSQIKIVRNK